MHGMSHLLSHHHDSDNGGDTSTSSISSDTRNQDTRFLQELLKHDNKLYFHERHVSRGSVSSAYSSYGSNSSNHQSLYHTIHGNGHPFHHHHHHRTASSDKASSTSPSPTNEHEKQHHHHSIQEMIRHFGRRLGHIRRQSESHETPKKREEDFRNRSQSLDGSARHPVNPRDADCETTYRIYESILRQGALRRGSLDPTARRLSLGAPAIPHRASDACLDPVHAAILFRDARGVSIFPGLYFALVFRNSHCHKFPN
ncbi:hypothetical protein X777_00290 [Ooceraea biroi]|uniref:Uncharacterized protein n=1 Tax=Ooceraea biroi TaxID=2015173 RepID=A0A026WTV6_OOCBI|nr:hypothetical protein X777_00290 [Ooceraea biroi]